METSIDIAVKQLQIHIDTDKDRVRQKQWQRWRERDIDKVVHCMFHWEKSIVNFNSCLYNAIYSYQNHDFFLAGIVTILKLLYF